MPSFGLPMRWHLSRLLRDPLRKAARRHFPLLGEALEPRMLLSGLPQLVSDIDSRPLGVRVEGPLVQVGSQVFFAGNDGIHGVELWKTDGTSAGTSLVKGKLGNADLDPRNLVNVNGTLFFSVGLSAELWKSDGTSEGTVLVSDQVDVAGYAYFTNVNGTLFFSGESTQSAYGLELWKSDGTSAGTKLVRDILPGSANSVPRFLTNVNGSLFFRVESAPKVTELWTSDGTPAGTVRIQSFPSGPETTGARYFTEAGGKLYFTAYENSREESLWTSDGTTQGTIRLAQIEPAQERSYPHNLANVGGNLFFTVKEQGHAFQLWKTGGTPEGTGLVKEFTGGGSGFASRWLTEVNGSVYFNADGGSAGRELWKSDGTAAGTVLVKNIYPEEFSYRSSFPAFLTNLSGTLLFTANDGVHGRELWKSDGTAEGTVLVHNIASDLRTSQRGSYPQQVVNFGGVLLFAANSGLNGLELWRNNGTTTGTSLIHRGQASPGSNPGPPVEVNGFAYIAADDGVHGVELWKSDGAGGTTTLVKDIYPGSTNTPFAHISQLTNFGGTLFFVAHDGVHGEELWKSDGTAVGTLLVKDIRYPTSAGSVNRGSSPGAFVNLNGVLYFSADDRLWKTDGTEAGTVALPDATSTPLSPDQLIAVDESMFFIGDVGTRDRGLYKFDGVGAPTLLKQINSASNLTNVNGTLFFTADGPDFGTKIHLWQSDGTANGTEILKPFGETHLGESNPRQLINVNCTLYFTTTSSGGGALWKSDGTLAGTVVVKSGSPSTLANVNGVLLYTSLNQGLWVTNGTPNQITSLSPLPPSPALYRDPVFSSITNVNGIAYFTDGDHSTGIELWRSDGTRSGTAFVSDLFPGSYSSLPQNLVNVNGTLFFRANDGTHGVELWSLDTGVHRNIAPSWDRAPDPILLMGSGPKTYPKFVAKITPGPFYEALQQVTVNLSVDRADLFDVSPALLADGTLTFTPYPDAFGTAIVSVVLQDDGGTAGGGIDTSRKSFTITINRRPEAVNDAYQGREDNYLFIDAPGMLDNDSDPDGAPLSVVVQEWPKHGTLILYSNGTHTSGGFEYQPDHDFNGTDQFTYFATDGHAQSAVVTVSLQMGPQNDPPRFEPGPAQFVTDESGPVVVPFWLSNLAAGPPDESDQKLTITVENSASSLFAVQPTIDATGTLSFTPAPNAVGTVGLDIVVRDNGGIDSFGWDSNVTFLTITVTKARPAHNAVLAPDVTGDGYITPLDALTIINYLNAFGPAAVSPTEPGAPYSDVNGDGHIAAGDVLEIINFLNAFGPTRPRLLPQANTAAASIGPDLLTLLAMDIAPQTKRRSP